MKKVYALSLLLVFLGFNLQAQLTLPDLSALGVPLDSSSITDGILTPDPTGERYKDPVFSQVVYTTGIPYGAGQVIVDSVIIPGQVYPLALDVYQPLGDFLSGPRPVIVLAFGGSFVYGARVSPDIVQLCTRFAQLGYVTVSIDYRLTDELLINPTHDNAYRAVGKAMHDMKAAIRFLRMQEETLGNVLNIDTDKIYAGGVSAGAFGALHAAYLDRIEEIPPAFQHVIKDIGGIEGNSGNPGFSSDVAGVVNLCGALGEADWMEVGDVPLVSMHGDEDGTVPYDSDTIRALDVNYPVDGSAAIHRHADTIGIKNAFYTFKGADHTPFILPNIVGPDEMAYMDTTFRFVRDFLFDLVSGEVTSVTEKSVMNNTILVFPNPASNFLNIQIKDDGTATFDLISTEGKKLMSKKVNATTLVDVSNLPRGAYTAILLGAFGEERLTIVLK